MEDVSRVSIASSKHEGEVGQMETILQTRDVVEVLHRSREFSQFLRVFGWGYAWKHEKNSSIAFIKYVSKTIRHMKSNAVFFLFSVFCFVLFFFTSWFKQIFLINRLSDALFVWLLGDISGAYISYQPNKARIWQYITNQNLRDFTAVFPYSHLNTAIGQLEWAHYPNYPLIWKSKQNQSM